MEKVIDEHSSVVLEEIDENEGEIFLDKEGIFVKIYTLENEIESQCLLNLFNDEGIRAIIQLYKDTALNGLFLPQKGYGSILVKKEDVNRALKILNEFKEVYK